MEGPKSWRTRRREEGGGADPFEGNPAEGCNSGAAAAAALKERQLDPRAIDRLWVEEYCCAHTAAAAAAAAVAAGNIA